MNFGDIEIIENNGKYGLMNRDGQSTVFDPIYEHIWAYDFMGEDGAFVLYLDSAYYLYDVAKDAVSESYKSMYMFDSHYLAVSQNYKDYKLFDPVLLFDREKGYGEADNGELIVFHVRNKVGLGAIGFNGGPENEPTTASYFEKYHLESVLLYPEFDEISPVYDDFMTFSHIETKRNGLKYLYSFEANGNKYSLTEGLERKGYEQIKYGEHYVSAFRDGIWEMYRDGRTFVGRSEKISSGYHNPYLQIDGKLLLGRTLAGDFLCDSVDEIVEGCGWEYEYVRYAVYKIDGKCGLWHFNGDKRHLLKNHYNSILPLYHDDGNGHKEVTHFVISDEKERKGVFDVKRGCFIISCSYKIIFPVKCKRKTDYNANIENDMLMGFIASGFLPKSTGVLGTDGEIICPLHFLNPESEAEMKKKMLTFVQHSQRWGGCYVGEDESPIYILRDENGCYAYYYWGKRYIDQAVDGMTIYQPKRKWKDDYFLIVKKGGFYGLYQDKMGLNVIEDIACDEIRLIEDRECFLIVKNGKSGLYSFKESSD